MLQYAAHAARIEVSYSLPNEVLTATRGTKFLIFTLKLGNPSNFIPGLRQFNTQLVLITFPGIIIIYTLRM